MANNNLILIIFLLLFLVFSGSPAFAGTVGVGKGEVYLFIVPLLILMTVFFIQIIIREVNYYFDLINEVGDSEVL